MCVFFRLNGFATICVGFFFFAVPISAQVMSAEQFLKSALSQEIKLKQLYGTKFPSAAIEKRIRVLNNALEEQTAKVFKALQKINPKDKAAVKRGMQVIEQIQKVAERNSMLLLNFNDRIASQKVRAKQQKQVRTK